MRSRQGYGLSAFVLSCMLLSPITGCTETVQTTLPSGLITYPGGTSEKTSAWAEQLLGQAVTFKAMHDNGVLQGNFDPYVQILGQARDAYRAGDRQTTYDTVNQFMVMLETRVGDIDPHAADKLWDECYRWTPDEYHARDRHVRAVGHDKLNQFEEFIRYQDERSSYN